MATKKTTSTKKTTKKAASRGGSKKASTASASKKSKATPKRPDKSDRPKRVSGLDLAAQVLAAAKEPLSTKSIAEKAIAAGWKTNGKTPHATLYAAIIREIDAKGSESRFKKTARGLFTHA
ncbi:MAG TPA: winged helix-turn-helix domain-containing protein [Phycisphaerae bacterium]|nr:winged helix-turn-helix domain-containing protein [Phycisphaerae bacterium]